MAATSKNPAWIVGAASMTPIGDEAICRHGVALHAAGAEGDRDPQGGRQGYPPAQTLAPKLAAAICASGGARVQIESAVVDPGKMQVWSRHRP